MKIVCKLGNLIVKLNFYKLISYLVDNCISLACSRSRQTLEKNVLSWTLDGTSSVASIRQVSSQHPASLLHVCAHAYFLFLFGANVLRVIGSIFRSFIINYIYIRKFNFCTNKMRLDKVTWNIQSLSVCFFKIFTTVAIIFHNNNVNKLSFS